VIGERVSSGWSCDELNEDDVPWDQNRNFNFPINACPKITYFCRELSHPKAYRSQILELGMNAIPSLQMLRRRGGSGHYNPAGL